MTVANGNIDYTQPLATLLKVATTAAHEQAEHSQGAGWLTRGELDKEEYVRFLMMLYHVYDALEAGLEKHSSHPALSPTYNPTLLARAPSIASDIAHLLSVPEDAWEPHPLHRALMNFPPEPFTAYVSRIRYLSDEAADPSPLLAHAYVRYLGDLSGGQVIRRSIAKAYGTSEDEEGKGTQFYAFGKLGGGGAANAGDMRRIKDWFRAGMNTGGGDDASRKQAIAEEAIYAFELNMGLFGILRPPSNAKSASQEPARAPLGNPSLPPTPPPESTTRPSGNGITASDKYSPLQSNLSIRPQKLTEKSFSVSSVIAIVLAATLTHFLLVTNGFTGASGYGKLEAVWKWIGEHISSILGSH
ncbi:hypothetical protein ACEPAF_9944 [Sanghuangporus sanghuang]